VKPLPVRAEFFVRTNEGRRANMINLIVTLRNFANAFKIIYLRKESQRKL
jgi:hypothetical protein